MSGKKKKKVLTAKEVKHRFSLLLDAMNLPPGSKKRLKYEEFPLKKKHKYYKDWDKHVPNGPGRDSDIIKLIEDLKLKRMDIGKLCEYLLDNLAENDDDWVFDFVDCNGVLWMFECLTYNLYKLGTIRASEADEEKLEIIVECFYEMLNHEAAGLPEIVAIPDSFHQFINCLTYLSLDKKAQLFDLLVTLLLLSAQLDIEEDCWDCITKAFHDYRISEPESFRQLFGDLEFGDDDGYKAAFLTFINTLIVKGESLADRVSVRQDMMEEGIVTILQEMESSTDNDDVLTQIEIFQEELEADAADLKQMKQEREKKLAAKADPSRQVMVIWNKFKQDKSGSDVEDAFMRMLKSMTHLAITHPDEPKIWNGIDRLVYAMTNAMKTGKEIKLVDVFGQAFTEMGGKTGTSKGALSAKEARKLKKRFTLMEAEWKEEDALKDAEVKLLKKKIGQLEARVKKLKANKVVEKIVEVPVASGSKPASSVETTTVQDPELLSKLADLEEEDKMNKEEIKALEAKVIRLEKSLKEKTTNSTPVSSPATPAPSTPTETTKIVEKVVEKVVNPFTDQLIFSIRGELAALQQELQKRESADIDINPDILSALSSSGFSLSAVGELPALPGFGGPPPPPGGEAIVGGGPPAPGFGGPPPPGGGPPPPPGGGPPPPGGGPPPPGGGPPVPGGGPPVPGGAAAGPKFRDPNRPKMVPWRWYKVPDYLASGVFTGCAEEHDTIVKKLNTDEILRVFAAKKPGKAELEAEAKAKAKAEGTDEADDGKKKSNSLPKVFSAQKCQIISIVGRRITRPIPDVCKAINTIEESYLTSEKLRQLRSLFPGKEYVEDEGKLLGFIGGGGKPTDFAPPEKTLYTFFTQVPRVRSKIYALLFAREADTRMQELRSYAATVKRAFEELQSPKVKKLIEIALALGNYVNNPVNQVRGFRMASLVKLSDVRSKIKENYTLMHAFAKLIDEKFPEIADFSKGLMNLEDASRCFESLVVEYTFAEEEYQTVKEEYIACKEDGNEAYIDYLGDTVEFADNAFADIKAIKKEFEELGEHFLEKDAGELGLFFDSWKQFVDKFESAVLYMRTMKKKEAAMAKKREMMKRKEELLAAKKQKKKEMLLKKRKKLEEKQKRRKQRRKQPGRQKKQGTKKGREKAQQFRSSVIDADGLVSDILQGNENEGVVKSLIGQLRKDGRQNFSKIRGSRIGADDMEDTRLDLTDFDYDLESLG